MVKLIAGLPLPKKESGQLLTQHYQGVQRQISQRGTRAIGSLWNRVIEPAEFSKGWKIMSPIVNGIVSTHYSMSAANAAEYYANARAIADQGYWSVPGQQPDESYIDNVMGAMGPGQFFHFLNNNYSDDDASDMAMSSLTGAANRMILMGGRDTITDAANQDPQAQGWERIISPGACGFCAMLAGRGGVYTSETADFQAHDDDHCVAAPVFEGQESANADLSDEWGDVTAGLHGSDAIAAWNAHWEGGGNGGSQD